MIRREFDLSEGDAYNRALVSRAERRLKNLSYFKTARVSAEPGSAPDRVILNVEVEEQLTGEFSVSGGYSTADGFLAEVSVAERNLLGRGFYGKASLQYGQNTQGSPALVRQSILPGLSSSPWSRCVRQGAELDQLSSHTRPTTLGAGGRLGFALQENLGLQLRYSIYQQEINLPFVLRNCNNINPDGVNTFPTPDQMGNFPGMVRNATRMAKPRWP